VGLTTPHLKNKLVTNILKKPRTSTDSLDKRSERKKIYMRFGIWNVRSIYRVGSPRAVSEEISIYNLRFVGVQ
jgi:hypothetical protein